MIFTDGFLYHKDRVADDTVKREAILRSGRFRLWILSWKDVQSVFQAQGDYATATLIPQNMPSGTQMYQPTVAGRHAEELRTDKLSTIELLVKYLELPDSETLFLAHAKAYAFSLLEPRKRNNAGAFTAWEMKYDAISEALYGQEHTFSQNDTIFGTWIPRQSSSHLEIYTGVAASDMKDHKTNADISVFAALLDSADARTDKYEVEWNGFWQFFNVMQFLGSFAAVTTDGLAQGVYDAIPLSQGAADAGSATAAPAPTDEEWNENLQYISDEAKGTVAKLISIGVPSPSTVGYELENDAGASIAEAEMAWEDVKVVYLTKDQMDYKQKFEQAGWSVITDETELDKSIFEGGQ